MILSTFLKIVFTYLSISCFVNVTFSQHSSLMDAAPSVGIPTPAPFSFAKYGNLQLEGNSGLYSTHIPLYNQLFRDIPIDVSLGYSSPGIIVDELGGILGNDWVLNAGGIVTRVMRGLPDEQATVRWYPTRLDVEEHYDNIIKVANEQSVDSEQDWFSYNVNGVSGKFYLDENLNIISSGGNDEKIEMTITPNTSSYGKVIQFTITDINGFRYILGGSSDFMEGNIIHRDCFVGPKAQYQSTWFLKQIISPRGNSVTFEYDSFVLNYPTAIAYNRFYDRSCGMDQVSQYLLHIRDCLYSTQSSTKTLAKIKFGNSSIHFGYDNIRKDGGGKKLSAIKLYEGSVLKKSTEFLYDEVVSDILPQNPRFKNLEDLRIRYFLKTVTMRGSGNESGASYKFEYYNKESLPSRFSYSKDKYGFYNGSNNYSPFSRELINDNEVLAIVQIAGGTGFASADLEVNPSTVHYGLLKKIIYPTGGVTEVTFEPNKSEESITKTISDQENLSLTLPCGSREVVRTFQFQATDREFLYEGNVRYDDVPNSTCTNQPDYLHDQYSVQIIDLSNNSVVHAATRKSNEFLMGGTSLVIGKSYQVKFIINSRFNALAGGLGITFNKKNITLNEIVYQSGNRVKSIKESDENGVVNNRVFYYNTLTDINSNITSLNSSYRPVYHEINQVKIPCEFGLAEIFTLNISNSSIHQLYNFRNGNVFYGAITESFIGNGSGNNGYLETRYSVNSDHAPLIGMGPIIHGLPFSNISEGINGNVLSRKWFDGSKKLLQEERFEYTILKDAFKNNFAFRKNFDLNYPHTLSPAQQVMYSYSAGEYRNYFRINKINKIFKVIHQPSGEISQEFVYEYKGNGHYQTTKETYEMSSGTRGVVDYIYSKDQGANGRSFVDSLKLKNILTPLILKRNTNGIIIEESIDYGKFNNLVLLQAITQKIGPVLNKKITISLYDSYGNPVEIKNQEMPNTVYLWGYGGQYPIAKIENATYSEVVGALGSGSAAILSALNAYDVSDGTITSHMST
ncbi:hypothetical protein, partial [Sphingobacterium daejeonense]|uniref:hypothetical protein n=1 Tax=Sphingobacterium daejeonense TaxID=371142 RepID=UPI003D310D1E